MCRTTAQPVCCRTPTPHQVASSNCHCAPISEEPHTMQASHHELRQAFAQARQERKARHRDIAQSLEISEGELLAAHVGHFASEESPLQATRLRAEWPKLIESLEPLGPVMALTRNESCVHEKVGVYSDASSGPHG